jgi:hypothetical protein
MIPDCYRRTPLMGGAVIMPRGAGDSGIPETEHAQRTTHGKSEVCRPGRWSQSAMSPGPPYPAPSTHRGAAHRRHLMVQFNTAYLPRSAVVQSPDEVAPLMRSIRFSAPIQNAGPQTFISKAGPSRYIQMFE